jgi:hypothetical protein
MAFIPERAPCPTFSFCLPKKHVSTSLKNEHEILGTPVEKCFFERQGIHSMTKKCLVN